MVGYGPLEQSTIRVGVENEGGVENPRESGVTARQGWIGRLALGVGLLMWIASASPAVAKSKGKAADDRIKQIAGWVERITMLPSRALAVAKLDTGAKTSSIHAEDIERSSGGAALGSAIPSS